MSVLVPIRRRVVAAGVIDHAKVIRTAFQNAASIARCMLTTEVMIANVQDDKFHGGMGMGNISSSRRTYATGSVQTTKSPAKRWGIFL